MDRYNDARLLLTPEVHDRIRKSKILVFGAGGIGCELLKNLVLVGFEDIHVVDMDTVDVSNLNRQFLFRSTDVGKPKCEVAAAKVKKFNPRTNVKFYHQNLFEFGLEFYEQFDLCINGLDNIEARKQVNRMCLLVKKLPMIDGGTQGYDGQVMTTHRGKTECYECQPKNPPKSYPVCTIRSNPSKLVHCVVWGKYLFNRLFGKQEEETEFLKEMSEIMNNRTSQQEKWNRLFSKLFHEDIVKLIELKEKKKWERGTPIPLKIPPKPETPPVFKDQSIPDLVQLTNLFFESMTFLIGKKEENDLKFDKDDEFGMKFVFSVSNLRAMNFRIPVQSHFDVKAIAGSIIPAIATSNAIIAGLQVFEAIKILSVENREQLPVDTERSSYLRRVPSTFRKRNKCLILGMSNAPPNKSCYICQSNEMCIRLYLNELSIGFFVENILKKELGMKDPWVVFDGKGIYESDMGEDDDDDQFDMKEYSTQKLGSFGISHGNQITATCMEIEQLFWKITFIDQQQFEEEKEGEEEEEEEDKIEKDKWYNITSKQENEKKNNKNRKKMKDEEDQDSDSSDIVVVYSKDDNNSSSDEVVILEDGFNNEEEEEERKREREEVVVEESDRKKRKIIDEDVIIE